jgi:hypothetical protein
VQDFSWIPADSPLRVSIPAGLCSSIPFPFFFLTNLAYSRVNRIFFRDLGLDLRVFVRLARPARMAGFPQISGTYLRFS